MAITPDSVLATFKDLTDEEEQQVNRLEDQLDTYITENYWEDGYVSWTVPETITLDQTRDLCRRFRDAGWKVTVVGPADGRVMICAKGFNPPVGIQQTRGKAN